MMWYSDGNEGEVMADLLKRFEKDNPDIKVTLDNVAYKVIQEGLPVQLEAGNGPDIARVTNIKAQAQYWLDLSDRCSRMPSTGKTPSAPISTGCGRTARTPFPAS